MPVCVQCVHPAEHLYTTYKTKSNIRLAACPRCNEFLDPLIEHPPLILVLDLILLKPRVFLHLLFNRGSEPLTTTTKPASPATKETLRVQRLEYDALRLVTLMVIAEVVVRLLPVYQSNHSVAISKICSLVLVVTTETIAQHAVTLCLVLAVLRWRNWYPNTRPSETVDGRQDNFHPLLVTLTLLYTSLLPLLLQLFLSIWYTQDRIPSSSATLINVSTALPGWLVNHLPWLVQYEAIVNDLWYSVDRIWAGTKLLGGMSAGFGLRVLLPTRPYETTTIVLAGWLAAGLASRLLEVFTG